MYRNATRRRVVRTGLRHGAWITSGALVGMLVLPATPARALGNWDAVAECESGGDWHADTGNGFYGGLQFKRSTWDEFGGQGSPAKASREEQIEVADRVLADQGPWAWPTCGPGRVFPPNLKAWIPRPLRSGLFRL